MSPLWGPFPWPSRAALYGTKGAVSTSSRLRFRAFRPAHRAACFALLAALGCGAGGPYNFARGYEPLSSEKPYYGAAQTASYEDVKRDPNAYRHAQLAWFGVVTGMRQLDDGRVRLGLSLRAHQPRHLCADESRRSCRVTVSEKDLGSFSVELALTPGETEGKERVWQGSLLKVYGSATGEYDDEGGPLLTARYHRHWPRGYYVTTAQREAMRR